MSREAAKTVADAAAALAGAPSDLGAWYRLARALDGAGNDALAARAFASLGDAANRVGRVALAIACACQLRETGSAKEAGELVQAIARLHSRDSKLVDPKAKAAPKAPPPASKPPPPRASAATSATLDSAFAAATAALDAASRGAKVEPGRLPVTPLVSGLSREEVCELAKVVHHRVVPAGTTVIEVGDPAKALFWIARGTMRVSRGDHELGELRAGAFFGEIALVGATDRTAKVSAQTETWLLDIPAESVERLAGRSPRLAKVLANYARARILANVMRTSGLFSRLSDDEKRSLLSRFDARMVEAGEHLLSAGAANDHLFVVASGQLEVRDGKNAIATLSAGEGVGERSLLSRQPAAYDVVATTRCAVLGLPREAFDDLAVAHPGLLAEAYKLLVDREQEGSAAVHDASDLIL